MELTKNKSNENETFRVGKSHDLKADEIVEVKENYNNTTTNNNNSCPQEKTTQSVRATKSKSSATPRSKAKDKSIQRKYISVHTKRELFTKANYCCEYVDPKTHKKCQSRFYLEIDHIHPVALGGAEDIKNFRVFCRTHNGLAARRSGLNFNHKQIYK